MDRVYGKVVAGKETVLESVGLMVDYVKAEGDHVYWQRNEGEDPERVLDLAGGFGSTLLGHNHPEIVDVVKRCVDSKRPVHIQASHRGMAGLFKEALESRLKAITGESYYAMLLNTGTEAVEAALKHAEYEYTRRLITQAEKFADNNRRLKRHLENGKVELTEDFFHECEETLGQQPIEDLDSLLLAVAHFNQNAFNTQCFIASFKGAFHGKTKGSLATTWNRDARLPFIRNSNAALFVDNIDTFKQTIASRQACYYDFEFEPFRLVEKKINPFAAIIYEPIQGEGGVREISNERSDLLHFINEHYPETVVIADEIQCGLGRTGNFLESQARGLPNDYITFAKSLGGSFCKLSVVAIRKKTYYEEFSFLHTSTFAEDDLSAAVGKRTLEIISRDNIAQKCADVGEKLTEALLNLKQKWPGVISDVRGTGCMLGIEFCDLEDSPSATISNLCKEEMLTFVLAGYLLHSHSVRVMPSLGSLFVIRIQPSAYFDDDSLSWLVSAFDALCDVLANGKSALLIGHMLDVQVAQKDDELAIHPIRGRLIGNDLVERVGFITHLIDKRSLHDIDPGLAAFDEFEIERFNEKIESVLGPREVARRFVTSKMGRNVELILYGIQMDADAIEQDIRFNKASLIRDHVHAAYSMARDDGCGIVGFGGYTSIVTNNCQDFIEDQPAVTSGNSLTVATSLSTLRCSAEKNGIDYLQAHVAVCGAAGNIGQVHSALLALNCAKLTLIGREGSQPRIRRVVDSIASELIDSVDRGGQPTGAIPARVANVLANAQHASPEDRIALVSDDLLDNGFINISVDLADLKAADIIVSATNSARPLILPEHVATNKTVLISDVAVPGDVQKDISNFCPNVKLIRGGIVNMPDNSDFTLPGMLLDPGQIYACAGEAIMLGLSGIKTNFSVGTISTQRVREAEMLASIHGFELDREKTVSVF